MSAFRHIKELFFPRTYFIDDEPLPTFRNLPLFMRYRWIFVILFLFPMSFLFEAFNRLSTFYHQLTNRGVDVQAHNAKVKRVQAQVKAAVGAGKIPLCTDRPGWMAMALRPNAYKAELNRIKILDMSHIISIDTANKLIRVEPYVTVAQLTAALSPLGYTLPVIPELDDLTVGGLLLGVGVESSSHVYGLFHDSVVSAELVLSSGELIKATADNEHKALFRALPWSYGTFGFLVAAEIRLVPAKRYVHLHYHPCYSLKQVRDTFEHFTLARDAPMFVEGLMFSPSHAVVTTGHLADDGSSCSLCAKDRVPPPTVNHLARWYKPWFYEHARSFFFLGHPSPSSQNSSLSPTSSSSSLLKNRHNGKANGTNPASGNAVAAAVATELIPLRDYYHRHTRSIFWQMRELVWFGNHPLFRLVFE